MLGKYHGVWGDTLFDVNKIEGGTNGQLFIGNSSTGYMSRATLTAGTGISVSNGAGSITLSVVGAGALDTNRLAFLDKANTFAQTNTFGTINVNGTLNGAVTGGYAGKWDADGNFGIGTTSFGTNSRSQFAIKYYGTSFHPASPVDSVVQMGVYRSAPNNYGMRIFGNSGGSIVSTDVPNVTGVLALSDSWTFTNASVTTGSTWTGNAVGLSYGGTNASLTAANGGLVYSTASALAISSVGSSGQYAKSTGAGAPTWAFIPVTKGYEADNWSGRDSVIMWGVPTNITIDSIRAVNQGGTTVIINLLRDRGGSKVYLLAADYTTTTTWADAGTEQNTAIQAGDVIYFVQISAATPASRLTAQIYGHLTQ